MPMGIDVSKYQGNVNWGNVEAAGISFAFARVSDGLNNPDPYFSQNWSGMKNAGILRGAYQYFRPTQSPKAQADLLISKLAQLQPGDLPPVLDVETSDGASASQILNGILLWQEEVEGAFERQIIIYTARYFWQDSVNNSNQFANRPLWVASYTNAPAPSLPSAWPVWTFWQYTQSGNVNGVNGSVDRNRFNGSMDGLRALAGYPPPAPTPE
jgi:lysozyme